MTTAVAVEYERRRKAYNEAFRRWSEAVREGRCVSRAEAELRRSRNELADFILNGRGNGNLRTAVERLAYSLWEQAGRPPGSAEADWFHAETIVNGTATRRGA